VGGGRRNNTTGTVQGQGFGDGSPTRHLQLLTGESIEVDVIDMSSVGNDPDNAPELIHIVPGPRLRRQVWLRTATGQRLAYATSWWEESHIDEYLKNRSLPIWTSLALSRTELYRDVQGIHYGSSKELSVAFGDPGPFLGRHYLLFSPYLEKYLGQAKFDKKV